MFGLVFLMCGLAFKVSAAPFHMWTPDVYEGAPTPVVAFFAAAPKLAAMVLLARVLTTASAGRSEQWRQVILTIAMISVLVGAFAGLVQKNLKRLWAYSSIANIGYALVGLPPAVRPGRAVHAGVHGAVYGRRDRLLRLPARPCHAAGDRMETLADMAGLVRERPGIALVMTAFSLSVLGLPPFSGSGASSMYSRRPSTRVSGLPPWRRLVRSVVAAFYYLRLVKTMWFDPPVGAMDASPLDAKAVAYAAALFSFPLVLVALALLDPAATAAAAALGLS